LLKGENDRLVKMLYEKEQQSQEQMRGQIDVKDKKIRQAETEMNHQKKLVEDLRLELVSKQLDRDNLKSQLINQSFSPLLFLNDHSRSEFWKMITRYETEAINF
jgi:DNA-binding XRE family transcriptional regulator